MKKIRINVPATVQDVAQALDVKDFALMAELIRMEIFLSLQQVIDVSLIFRLGEQIGVKFQFFDDDGEISLTRDDCQRPVPRRFRRCGQIKMST